MTLNLCTLLNLPQEDVSLAWLLLPHRNKTILLIPLFKLSRYKITSIKNEMHTIASKGVKKAKTNARLWNFSPCKPLHNLCIYLFFYCYVFFPFFYGLFFFPATINCFGLCIHTKPVQEAKNHPGKRRAEEIPINNFMRSVPQT